MTTTLNLARFTLLRLERGLAIRQLALDSGIDVAVLNRLDADGIAAAPSLTFAQFLRLAETLGVDPAELLRPDEAGPPLAPDGPAPDDAALLGALLHDLTGTVPAVVVAQSFAWTLPRTLAATDALNALLTPAGLTVQQQSGRLLLRALNDAHTTATLAARRNPRANKRQRLLTPNRARLAYRAMQQPLSQHAFSEDDRREVAVLINAGIVEMDNNRDIAITTQVRTSVHPDGQVVTTTG